MATAAQIEANRRNAQKSSGPKTDEGKARIRLNALKRGMTARTVMPVLPQEDPEQLEERTEQWTSDMQPRNVVERDLVGQAARLSYAIERGERIETAHLAARVREAAREQTQQLGARRLEEVHELGRKLLYIAGPAKPNAVPRPPWEDDPAVFVRGLEETAVGCRWLLARWAEYHNLLDRKSSWRTAVLLRFIRLQGKQMVESVFDPTLNSIFLAWDVLEPRSAKKHWGPFRERMPLCDPAFRDNLYWREIGSRPRDKAEAWAVLYAVVDQHVGRLKELLAKNEAIAAEEAVDWADRAALDTSPAFERHRRYQSAKTRELLRTLEALRKMRQAEIGVEYGKWRMANANWRRAEARWRRADVSWRMTEAGGRMTNARWRMTSAG